MSGLNKVEVTVLDMRININMTPKYYIAREADVGLDINVLAEEVSLEQYNENKENLTKFVIEGFSEREFTLNEIDKLMYDEIQSLRLYGVQIRADIKGTVFILGSPASLNYQGLIHSLESFGNDVKFNLVLGEFNRVSTSKRIDITEIITELKSQE